MTDEQLDAPAADGDTAKCDSDVRAHDRDDFPDIPAKCDRRNDRSKAEENDGPAIERIKDSEIEELCVTNSIALTEEKQIDKIKVLTVAPLLGEAIRRIHNAESVSGLFN